MAPSAVRAGREVRVFRPSAPEIHPERILRIQGYSDLNRVRPVIRRAAESMAAIAARMSVPAVAYRRVPIHALEGEVLEVEGARFTCLAFSRQLAGCVAISPFVLSVGDPIPQRVVALAEAGDLLEGLLLETAGWLAIEDATRKFKVRLRGEALERGERITSRMGPGYSYKVAGRMHTWSLEEQRGLFALFEGAATPAQLMASCAMTPKLSRSGLYGLAPTDESTPRSDT